MTRGMYQMDVNRSCGRCQPIEVDSTCQHQRRNSRQAELQVITG